LLPPVLHARAGRLRLAAAGARQAVGVDKLHLWRVARDSLDRLGHFAAERLAAGGVADDGSILDLDFEVEGIEAVAFIDDDAEIRARFGELHQRGFYLAREDDQAPDGDGIVAAALDGGDLRMRASTGAALLPPRAREVAAAIADHRRAVCGEPGPDQFAILALLDPFARIGVDALHQEGVRPGVHTVAYLALAGHARAEQLGHAELVVGGD